MKRYLGPRCKLCRKSGEKLFLKGEKCNTNCILNKRKTASRIVSRAATRESEYAKRLREKQKLKSLVCLTEEQFINYYRQAQKLPGQTGKTLLLLLETRLDNVVKLSGFAPTIRLARQLILHGKIKVNNCKLCIPGYKIKPGDKILLDEKLKENTVIKRWIENFASPPSWLNVDKEKFSCEVISLPQRSESSFPINESLIVEMYSKR
ncbi:MAG: 30S ribosomal protein S4 [Elusimicrobiota bacterium]|nr:30S ribosomal protein S4 [Elusimicrobiota bacterium]